ncbi:MAG: chromosomal replication initiator protein DnaA [Prevotella sp.]|nr:chromosomal replication initiator protein DnaA [Prevotella sp.]
MNSNPRELWQQCLELIKGNVTEQQFNTWFRPIVFGAYQPATKTLLVNVPSMFVYEYLEENYVDLLKKVLTRVFGNNVRLNYNVLTDKTNNLVQTVQPEPTADIDTMRPQVRGNQPPSVFDAAPLQPLDSQLNPHHTFQNFIEGDSNKLCRSVGLSIAEHPQGSQFNPMFVFGPSGCGKTHLINAMGVRTKELYPQKRVLYVSARLFQVQYSNAVLQNKTNDFINFYQTIDMLIVDDIQEWMTSAKTQVIFFHIFNHLLRNGRRIVLASDRPPVDLKGMSDRLITRFSGGLLAEIEKPNVQLCIDILHSKIKRDGLRIPEDVVQFIAQTANGSVRDLEGVINSLLAFSIVYNGNIDMRLAERVIKRAVKMDDHPLTMDDIIETVCNHYNVSPTALESRSRKRDLVLARQVSMYLAQKHTKMPTSRIGKLVGGRDHSTVLHSCSLVEQRMKIDKLFCEEILEIEKSFKLKQ